MDSIKDFFNSVMDYTHLSDRRNQQLVEEKKLDEKLYRCYEECPHDVFSYVMKTRDLNRTMSTRIYEGAVHQSPVRYKEYMDAVDDAQDIRAEHARDICKQLRSKLGDITKNEKA